MASETPSGGEKSIARYEIAVFLLSIAHGYPGPTAYFPRGGAGDLGRGQQGRHASIRAAGAGASGVFRRWDSISPVIFEGFEGIAGFGETRATPPLMSIASASFKASSR